MRRYPIRTLHFGGICVSPLNDGNGKMRHERRKGAQFSREDEIEQTPQFLQIILNRRACFME